MSNPNQPTNPVPATASDPASAAAPAEKGAASEKPSDRPEKSRYRETLNLPQTSFPMKANLVQNEPASQKRWSAMALYAKVRAARAGAERFVFHDGPPYANGSIHLGHLMNKVLKDFVVRSKTMDGLDCPYVPGWDCHGLPIEHKVMTDLVEGGKFDKMRTLTEDQRRMAVRRECQKYAEKWVKTQGEQFQRLSTLADYADPYLTMAPRFEGATLEVLADLLDRGLVRRALKPVHWSVANETALAEAELEYYDREDPSVYVDFEAADADAVYDAFGLPRDAEDDAEEASDDEDGAEGGGDEGGDEAANATRPAVGRRPSVRPSFMIWTTTPWTLPANVAVAVNPKFEYALVFVDGNVTVMATELLEKVCQKARSEEVSVLARTTGDRLVGLKYRHPFVDLNRAEGVAAPAFVAASPSFTRDAVFTLVAADYVTLEDGTGLVHTAPGHGEEDYQTGLREGLPVYCPVRADGTYDETVPAWLRGAKVWDANTQVTVRLRESGHMFHDHVFTHSYPHDWRSKTPTIFRATDQWFVRVDEAFDAPSDASGQGGPGPHAGGGSLRERALSATRAHDHQRAEVAFVPEWGRNRMRGMLESRPDWCVSRQRAWGLPIPAFELPDGRTFMTGASVRAVAQVVRAKGSDAWFTLPPADLLANYDPATDPRAQALEGGPVTREMLAQAKKGRDILDVWFESGSSWNGVLRERGLGYPADLYLEGSDQHRGWFQLSLLPALGVTGHAPFRTLLTHGFMVDKDGKKLSKSKGDTVEGLFSDYGVDVLRWWVASLAYENDVKVDRSFFDLAGEAYRKVRNTLRFMLSNLADFYPEKAGLRPHADGPGAFAALTQTPPQSLDAWVLGAFDALTKQVVAAYHAYDFRGANLALYDFCNETLSATYLAAVKDRLYCDAKDSPRRRRTQAALFAITDGLCRLLAPVLPHTADEAYRALHRADAKDAATTVHLRRFPHATGVHADPRWASVMETLRGVGAALEQAKKELGVENPLDAGVALPDKDGVLARFDATDLADLLGVSRVTLEPGADAPRVSDLRAEPRCERSWKRDGTVRQRSDGGWLTDRDAAAVGVA